MSAMIGKACRALMRQLKSSGWAGDLVTRGFQAWYEIPVAPTHYYSPLPDLAALREKMPRWYRESGLGGVELAVEEQLRVLEALRPYREECRNLPDFEAVTAAGYGPGYGEVEASLLHCMIRHLKPGQVIEIGSGVSTCYALEALRRNRSEGGKEFSLSCIEPYPSAKFRELAGAGRLELHAQEVQDVELGCFDRLGPDDLLFIDSSHVCKLDSDINHIYLEILPRLAKGVVIHIHDIPFPYATCHPEHPAFAVSMLWNEAALVRALLMYSRAFRIVMCQSYLHYKFPEAIKGVVERYDPSRHFPTSLWLRKVV